MLGEVIHVLEQWYPTFFIPILCHKCLILISSLTMTYVGCTRTLIAENDMVEVFDFTFGGFPKMLNKKQFTQNVRGLKILVGELLKPIFNESAINGMEKLEKIID